VDVPALAEQRRVLACIALSLAYSTDSPLAWVAQPVPGTRARLPENHALVGKEFVLVLWYIIV